MHLNWILISTLGLTFGQRRRVRVFDYIVVGSGPTGSMTAIGLAEKGFKTLLIDAGPDYSTPNITTPAFHVRASEDPNIAWDFYVKHYDEHTKMRQRVLYPRVGGLGGCTIHNALLHILPNREDFEKMARLTDDESWGEENMRRYYNKIARPNTAERLMPMRAFNQLGATFQSLSQSAVEMMSEKSEAWLKLSRVDIYNLLAKDSKLMDLTNNILGRALVADMVGFDINEYTLSGENAIDTESSFLAPINVDIKSGMKRKGIYEHLKEVKPKIPLSIWTNTLATKILINKNNRAFGIKFQHGKFLYRAGKRVNKRDGKIGYVHARKEVIISAGTFNTPQLMMLSGIGDPDHLAEFGIKPRVNLPGVGKNLHDRYEVSVNVRFDSKFAVLDGCTFVADKSDPCFKKYVEEASGAYTFNGVLTGSTVKSSPTLSVPDLFYLSAPIYFTGYHPGMGEEVVRNGDVFSILILKAHSKNRGGYVKLRSRDPRDTPDINFRYFQEGADKDLPAIIKGIRDARYKFKEFTSGYKEISPGAHLKTDKQLSDYILRTAWGHHATGTMKIGKTGDPMTVLDGKFRVKGVQSLRVADMSIFEDIPGYFPVLYLYLVGAKAADVIASGV